MMLVAVSESNTSLLKFSQPRMRMAETRKMKNIERLNVPVAANAIALPRQMGMIATLYIGGLIAASQSLDLGAFRGLTVITQN
jgi:hypothetical protein